MEYNILMFIPMAIVVVMMKYVHLKRSGLI